MLVTVRFSGFPHTGHYSDGSLRLRAGDVVELPKAHADYLCNTFPGAFHVELPAVQAGPHVGAPDEPPADRKVKRKRKG